MRTSVRACLLFAVAAIVALQVAQPVSASLVDREVFENITPSLYAELDRRQGPQTAVPSSTSSGPAPTATIGGGCQQPSDCISGHCSRGDNRCLPAPGGGGQGDFCTRDYQCEGGSYCYRGECRYIKPNGNSCYTDSGCASGNCYKGTCSPTRSVSNGNSCTQSVQCKDGSFCNNNRCATLRSNGKYCYKNEGCTSGNCNNNKCASSGLARLGQSCSQNSNCQSGACFKGACRAKRARGRSCSINNTCISGRCHNGICQ